MDRRLKVLVSYLMFTRAQSVRGERPSNLLDLVQNSIRLLDVEKVWGMASIASDALARLSIAQIEGVENIVTKILPYFFGKFTIPNHLEEEVYEDDYFEEGKLVQKNEQLQHFFTQLHRHNPQMYSRCQVTISEYITRFPLQTIRQMVVLKGFFKILKNTSSDFLVNLRLPLLSLAFGSFVVQTDQRNPEFPVQVPRRRLSKLQRRFPE